MPGIATIRPGNGKARATLQAWSCLSMFVLLNIGSCGKPEWVSVKQTVTVSSCSVPKLMIATPKSHASWTADQNNDYTIVFNPKLDPQNNPPEITPFPATTPPHSLPIPKGTTATWDTSHVPTNCGDKPHGATKNGCYFKYNIYYTSGMVLCADPGVQVQPDN